MNNIIAPIQNSSVGVLFVAGRYLIVNYAPNEKLSLWSFPFCYSEQPTTCKKDLKEHIAKNLGLPIEVTDLLDTYVVSCHNKEFKRWVYWITTERSNHIHPTKGIFFKWITLEDLLTTSMMCVDSPLIKSLEDLSFA